jgi:hypothetical protein
MQIAWFVRMSAFLVLLGLAAIGGGCSSGSTPLSQEDSEKVRGSHKGTHQQLKEAKKEAAKQIEQDKQKQAVMRKGARRGVGAR